MTTEEPAEPEGAAPDAASVAASGSVQNRDDGTGEPRKRRRRLPWIIGSAVVLLAAAGWGTAAALGAFDAPPEAPSPVVAAEPRPEPEPAPEPEPPAEPVLDIPSVQHMPYSPVWNPPDEGQYVWQIVDPDYGYPETGGTRYILAHACESQSCAGDSFRALEAGDTLTFLGETFRVDEKREIMKDDIAAQDIWHHDPNRLVIITCIIETTWDQSDKNDLIIATRV